MSFFKFFRKTGKQLLQEEHWRKMGQLAQEAKKEMLAAKALQRKKWLMEESKKGASVGRRVFRAGRTPVSIMEWDPSVGISVTRKKGYAKDWRNIASGGRIQKLTLKPGIKILRHKNIPRQLLKIEKFKMGDRTIKNIMPRDTTMKELIRYAKDKKYDAIDLGIIYPGSHEYRVVNPAAILEV